MADRVGTWAPVYPHIRYDDPAKAVAWLTQVFGLRERRRMAEPDGNVITAQLEGPDGGLIMVAGISPELKQWLDARVQDFKEQQGRPWPHLLLERLAAQRRSPLSG